MATFSVTGFLRRHTIRDAQQQHRTKRHIHRDMKPTGSKTLLPAEPFGRGGGIWASRFHRSRVAGWYPESIWLRYGRAQP